MIDRDYYFWLGDDGEPEPVTQEQFDKEIENARETERKWREVDID